MASPVSAPPLGVVVAETGLGERIKGTHDHRRRSAIGPMSAWSILWNLTPVRETLGVPGAHLREFARPMRQADAPAHRFGRLRAAGSLGRG